MKLHWQAFGLLQYVINDDEIKIGRNWSQRACSHPWFATVSSSSVLFSFWPDSSILKPPLSSSCDVSFFSFRSHLYSLKVYHHHTHLSPLFPPSTLQRKMVFCKSWGIRAAHWSLPWLTLVYVLFNINSLRWVEGGKCVGCDYLLFFLLCYVFVSQLCKCMTFFHEDTTLH